MSEENKTSKSTESLSAEQIFDVDAVRKAFDKYMAAQRSTQFDDYECCLTERKPLKYKEN